MSSKPKAKSLRAADGAELVSRWAKNKGVIHAQYGAEFGADDDAALESTRLSLASQPLQDLRRPAVQVPTGPGLDRAGFLARNPNVQQGGAGTSPPGVPNTSNTPYPESANALRYPAPMPAGAGRGNINPALVDPNKPMTPSGTAAQGIPMPGNPGVFQHGKSTFSDSATAPSWGKNTGNPSAQNHAVADSLARRSGQAPDGWSGQNLGMNSGTINPGMQARGSLRMAAGGTYEDGIGGQVPGKGKGDKFKALYEAEEVVVSNYDLDKTPGLREGLRNLRAEGLHERGMTPEQADAKALGGKTLRAKDGVWQPTNPRFADAPTSHRGLLANDEIIARAEAQRTLTAQQSAAHKAVYAQDAAAKLAAEADATKAALNKASPIGAPAAPAAAPAPTATPAAPAATPPDTRGLLRKSLDGAKGYAGGAYNAVKSVGPALVAGGAGYGAARIAQDIGNPDNSTRGTYVPPEGALRIPNTNVAPANTNGPHNFFNDTDAGRNLKTTAGALAALPGLGLSTQAASGAFKVGTGTVRAVKAAETLGVATAAGARAGMDSAPGQASAQPPKLTIAGDATMPGQDPNRPQLREEAPAIDWAARKAERDALTQKDIALGDRMESQRMASYRPAQAMSPLRARLEALSTQPGKMYINQAKVLQQLRNDDLGHDASMASTQAQAQTARMNNESTNRTTLRGQDMDYERAMAPMRYAAQMRGVKADVLRRAGGDYGVAGKMWAAQGGDPKDFLDAQTSETSNATALQNIGEKASDQSKAAFKGLFDTTDSDGKAVSRPDLEAQAQMTAMRASGGKWGTLSPDQRSAHVADAHSYVTLLDSARQHQNNGWMQKIGLGAPDTPWGGLPTPDQMAGAKLADVGWGDAKITPNVKYGDKVLTLADGRKMYLGNNVSGEHLKYLTNHGVKTGN